MKNLAANVTDTIDPQAFSALIASVLTLAVEDLALDQDSPNYQSAHRFIFGDWSAQCDRYLLALDMNPERFRAALKAKMVNTEVA